MALLLPRKLLPGSFGVCTPPSRRHLVVAKHKKAVQPEIEQAIKRRLLRKELTYSTHARRRIEEREVSPEEILEVLEQGHIDKGNSKFGGERSPSYCMEKRVGEPPRLLRVVFAQNDNSTMVVTVAWKEGARQ